MKFLIPSGLWLLLVLAGIAAIYVLRMPRRKVFVADLAPWLKIARAGRRISSERRMLYSLLFQAAIVIALVLANARPYFAQSQGPRLELVLIDLSASMRAHDATPFKIIDGLQQPASSGPSRLDLAKRALQTMIRALNPGDRMTIVGVGARTTIVASGESESALLERSAATLEARNEVAAFSAACQLAKELAKSEKNVRLTVISDGAADSSDFAALKSLPAEVGKIRCLNLGEPAENVGIVGFKSRKKLNSDEIETTVTLLSSAKNPVRVPVELYLDGKVQRASLAEVAPGATQVVTFSMDYRRGGTLKARLAIQDALLEDNEAVDFLPQPRRMKVALVTRDPLDEKTANDYYLARVLRSDTGVEGGFLSSADYAKIASDKNALKSEFEAVIFDNWAPPPADLPSCHALFINAESAEIPLEIKGILSDKLLIRRWDEGHPLMNYLNLRDVFLKKAKDLNLLDKSTDVVAELVSSPLIVAREIGSRKIACVGFNPSDSDIQFKKELPLFVLNCIEWFKRGREPVTQIAPGEPMSIAVDKAWKSLTIQPPANAAPRKIDIPTGAETVLFYDTAHPGIYRYTAETERQPARGFAVNFGAKSETNLNVNEQIKIGTADDRGRILENRAEATTLDALVEHRISADLWLYFSWLALALLVIENYLFHRRIFF